MNKSLLYEINHILEELRKLPEYPLDELHLDLLFNCLDDYIIIYCKKTLVLFLYAIVLFN